MLKSQGSVNLCNYTCKMFIKVGAYRLTRQTLNQLKNHGGDTVKQSGEAFCAFVFVIVFVFVHLMTRMGKGVIV